MTKYLVLNGDMYGTPLVEGEYVDWSKPDVMDDEFFTDWLNTTVEEFAETNPHMIVQVIE